MKPVTTIRQIYYFYLEGECYYKTMAAPRMLELIKEMIEYFKLRNEPEQLRRCKDVQFEIISRMYNNTPRRIKKRHNKYVSLRHHDNTTKHIH